MSDCLKNGRGGGNIRLPSDGKGEEQNLFRTQRRTDATSSASYSVSDRSPRLCPTRLLRARKGEEQISRNFRNFQEIFKKFSEFFKNFQIFSRNFQEFFKNFSRIFQEFSEIFRFFQKFSDFLRIFPIFSDFLGFFQIFSEFFGFVQKFSEKLKIPGRIILKIQDDS